jgi:hypothetical protein
MVFYKKMKTTQCFDYTRKRPDRVFIKDDWIKFVIDNPGKTEVQSAPNAFFDRSFKED